MKTTEINLQAKEKRNTRDKLIVFLDRVVVKAVLILFFFFFLVFIVKSQNGPTPEQKETAIPLKSATNCSDSINSIQSMHHYNDKGFQTTCDLCDEQKPARVTNNLVVANNMVESYFQGEGDADECYKSKKSGNGLILATTFLGGPVAGLIPLSLCSSITPSTKHLQLPDDKTPKSQAYLYGYRNESRAIKKHNNLACYVLAGVVWTCLAIFLIE